MALIIFVFSGVFFCILLSVFTLDFTSFLNYFLYNFPCVYACLFVRLIHLKKEAVSEVLCGV